MSVELEFNGREEEEYILRLVMPKQETFTLATVLAPWIDSGVITSVAILEETSRYTR
jgi:hypothetical protein